MSLPRRSLRLRRVNAGRNNSSTPELGDADEEPWVWLGVQHPLLNDLVLKTLFGYVKGDDLKSCRLVCKKWNELSIPFAGSEFQVRVYGSSIHTAPDDVRNNQTIDNFIQLLTAEHASIKFENFVLGSFDVSEGVGKQFLELCAKNAKKFDLSLSAFEEHKVENISALLRSTSKLESFVMPVHVGSKYGNTGIKLFEEDGRPMPKLPFLKSLDDRGKGFHGNRRKVCPTFFEEFFHAAENITALGSYAVELFPRVDVSLEMLNVLDKLGRSIESLTVYTFNEKHLDILKKMCERKPLKHLSILRGNFQESDSLKSQLLELLKDNLISLRVIKNEHPLNLLQFPCMPLLKSLDLTRSDRKTESFYNFEEKFPVLETLRLGCCSGRGNYHLKEFLVRGSPRGFRQNECGPFPLMKSFILDHVTMTYHTFERTANAFPNLIELSLEIVRDGERILKKIWTHLPRLEKLSISGKLTARKNIDSFFTGITPEKENIERTKKSTISSLGEMTSQDRKERILELMDQYQTLPSIRNLTNLRHLELCLTLDSKHHRNRLSDFTGYLGLYTLKNLKHIGITGCTFSEMCSQVLVKDMELLTWWFREDKRTNIIPPRFNSKLRPRFISLSQ